MQGIVTAAPSEQILAMIAEATLSGFNVFTVTGNLTVNAISISVVVPITEEIEMYPTISLTKTAFSAKLNMEHEFVQDNQLRLRPQEPVRVPLLDLGHPDIIRTQKRERSLFI